MLHSNPIETLWRYSLFSNDLGGQLYLHAHSIADCSNKVVTSILLLYICNIFLPHFMTFDMFKINNVGLVSRIYYHVEINWNSDSKWINSLKMLKRLENCKRKSLVFDLNFFLFFLHFVFNFVDVPFLFVLLLLKWNVYIQKFSSNLTQSCVRSHN